MAYKLTWKEGKKSFESKKSFRTKAIADKKAIFMRQMDDDLPKSQRDKWLKTIRVIRVKKKKKIIRVKRKKKPARPKGYTGKW